MKRAWTTHYWWISYSRIQSLGWTGSNPIQTMLSIASKCQIQREKEHVKRDFPSIRCIYVSFVRIAKSVKRFNEMQMKFERLAFCITFNDFPLRLRTMLAMSTMSILQQWNYLDSCSSRWLFMISVFFLVLWNNFTFLFGFGARRSNSLLLSVNSRNQFND